MTNHNDSHNTTDYESQSENHNNNRGKENKLSLHFNKPRRETQNRESQEKEEVIHISEYTKALINVWKKGTPKDAFSPNKISVSQTVSFPAFLYEKMRNAVEFRDEHLIRRASIARIIKRRIMMDENGRNLAEPLVKELLWARYYENNTIGEDKVQTIQQITDKYLHIRNAMSEGRSQKEKNDIHDFIIDILSCEIEETLSPNPRKEAFINYAYQLLRNDIKPFNGDEMSKNIQVYIAIERTFARSDEALIKYRLLKLMLPDITQGSWKEADKIITDVYGVYKEIRKYLNHPFKDKIRNYIKKQIPPYIILKDIFKDNSKNLDTIFTNSDDLKTIVDESARKRYDETKKRLRMTGVRSFIYIVLTKVLFAFILELPYDIYIANSISYIPIAINVLFPPILMAIIILSVVVPGDDNTKKIYNMIKNIIVENPDSPDNALKAIDIGKIKGSKTYLVKFFFPFLYLFMYVLSFGTIIYILTMLDFNPISQGIFIFFVTLVTFFAYRVINITKEYLVVERENPLSVISDFFFLPIIRVGQWLSGEVLQRFNVFIVLLDLFIEMPLKVIVEVIDEWIHFVKLKKDELV